MAYFTYKRSGKNRYLVIRWKKRINGIPTIVKEVSVGTADELLKTLENNLNEINITAYSGGSTLCILRIEDIIGIRSIVNGIIEHHDTGMSPGDYFLLFIMNRLSDPKSKNGIKRWMQRDYASTLYPEKGSQDYWNFMDRITDEHISKIMKSIREKLLTLDYDFSKIFVDASNMYTFMEENDMARKGHNKAHRYDLNQISYYIGSTYDYIPLFWDAYPGNVHDSQTFPDMVKQLPPGSIVIFDRGYNSKENVDLLHEGKYIGALIVSDHRDLADLIASPDTFAETERNVYGSNHRIIVYHSSKLQRKRVRSFMNAFKKVYRRAKAIIESNSSDAVERAGIYLESQNLNETIILPDLRINYGRMEERLKLMGINAVFTNITDMDADGLIELYRKRNRVEHCFRTINAEGLAFPLYHWIPQKIKVHMFMSLIAYLYLALIYNEMHRSVSEISLGSTTEIMKDIIVVYAARGKTVIPKLDFKSEVAGKIGGIMKLDEIVRR